MDANCVQWSWAITVINLGIYKRYAAAEWVSLLFAAVLSRNVTIISIIKLRAKFPNAKYYCRFVPYLRGSGKLTYLFY